MTKKASKDYTNTIIGIFLFILFIPITITFIGIPIITNVVTIFIAMILSVMLFGRYDNKTFKKETPDWVLNIFIMIAFAFLVSIPLKILLALFMYWGGGNYDSCMDYYVNLRHFAEYDARYICVR